MKIALIVYGSRGDVQPMLALATGLMKRGHQVVFCASPDNEEFVKQYNCPFVPFGRNIREVFKNADAKGGKTGQLSPKEGKEIIQEQINKLPDKVRGCELILASGIILGVPSVADYLKIPYRFVACYPMILGTSKEDPLINRTLFYIGRSAVNVVLRGYINKQRKRLGVRPIKDVWQYWMGDNAIIACDKELNAAKKSVSFAFAQTGYMFLPSLNELPAYIDNFINAGKPPVYVGFGSNPIAGKKNYNEIFDEVATATKQRLIISKGWVDLPENENPDLLYVDDIPFEHVFSRLSAIIHHGGTGTLAYAARSGVPQAAFPFIADQFENRKQIVKLGLGPDTCDFLKMTKDSISDAISACINNDSYQKNAASIKQKLKDVDGLEMTVDLIEMEFMNLPFP